MPQPTSLVTNNDVKIQLRQCHHQFFDFFLAHNSVALDQKIAEPKGQTIHQRAVGSAALCQERFG